MLQNLSKVVERLKELQDNTKNQSAATVLEELSLFIGRKRSFSPMTLEEMIDELETIYTELVNQEEPQNEGEIVW